MTNNEFGGDDFSDYLTAISMYPLLGDREVYVARKLDIFRKKALSVALRIPDIARRVIEDQDDIDFGNSEVVEGNLRTIEALLEKKEFYKKNPRNYFYTDYYHAKIRECERRCSVLLGELGIDPIYIFNAVEELRENQTEEDVNLGSMNMERLLERFDKRNRVYLETRELFYNSNLRYVISIAKKYYNFNLTLMDRIQEGNLGLLKAIDRFDYRRGNKFSTYALWWIKQAIGRAVMGKTKIIKIPPRIQENADKVTIIKRKLKDELGRDPTDEELIKAAGINTYQLDRANMAHIRLSPVSYETEKGGRDVVIVDERIKEPLDGIVQEEEERSLNRVSVILSGREAQIICMRYGIGFYEKRHSLQEVGDELGLSRERIRQLEGEAIERLKNVIGEEIVEVERGRVIS